MQATTQKTRKLKTKAFHTDYHIFDLACKFTKNALIHQCTACGLKPNSRLHKDVIAKLLTDHILENIGSILPLLSVWDLELLRDLVQIGPGKGLAVYYEACCTVIFQTLLIVSFHEPNLNRTWYVMADELREAIGSKAEATLEDPAYRMRAEMLQYVQGLKTLYGIVPVIIAEGLLRRDYPEIEDNQKLLEDMARCPENSLCSIEHINPKTFSLVAPMVRDSFNDISDLEVIREEDIFAKVFTKEEILDAGQQPYPFFHCEAAQRLKGHMCEEYGITAILADSAMFGLWVDSQPIYDNFMRAVNLVNERITIEDQKDWDKLVVLVNEFLDAAPCWALGGWSVEEKRKGKVEYFIEEEGIEEEEEDDDDNDQNVVYTS